MNIKFQYFLKIKKPLIPMKENFNIFFKKVTDHVCNVASKLIT